MDSVKKENPAREKRRFGPILLALGALFIFGLISWLVWDKLSQDVWVYYTDDAGTKVGIEENKTRNVLWQDPQQNVFVEEIDPVDPEAADPVNQGGERLVATFSPNGTTMVLVRQGTEETGMDMYISQWNGRVWSPPKALEELNSPANDRGPAFSQDGEHLYFASDREGGNGGYDIYVARMDGEEWSEAESAGSALNTQSNELGPAPSGDGRRLFFSSDRAGKSEDIFVAPRMGGIASPEPSGPETEKPGEPVKPEVPKPEDALPPPLPKFLAGKPVGNLNSKGNDVQAALTRRGDHVFLASDRNRNKNSDFRL